jgi:hypothetical protein
MCGIGCQDVREYAGTWTGARVGDDAVRQGFTANTSATLRVDSIALQSLDARLTTSDGRFDDVAIVPLSASEADVLSSMTFDGAPVRVFVSFAPATDGGGDAMVLTALYADERIELRVLRGGPAPLYGIFTLRETGG